MGDPLLIGQSRSFLLNSPVHKPAACSLVLFQRKVVLHDLAFLVADLVRDELRSIHLRAKRIAKVEQMACCCFDLGTGPLADSRQTILVGL